jgi:hypothetical protein
MPEIAQLYLGLGGKQDGEYPYLREFIFYVENNLSRHTHTYRGLLWTIQYNLRN